MQDALAFFLLPVYILYFLVFCERLDDMDDFLVPLSIVGFNVFHQVVKLFVVGHINREFVVSFQICVQLLCYLALLEERSIER